MCDLESNTLHQQIIAKVRVKNEDLYMMAKVFLMSGYGHLKVRVNVNVDLVGEREDVRQESKLQDLCTKAV